MFYFILKKRVNKTDIQNMLLTKLPEWRCSVSRQNDPTQYNKMNLKDC